MVYIVNRVVTLLLHGCFSVWACTLILSDSLHGHVNLVTRL